VAAAVRAPTSQPATEQERATPRPRPIIHQNPGDPKAVALTAGSKLGPHEILAPLGAGGFGEVFRAKGPPLDGELALEVPPGEVASGPTHLHRLQKEAKAAEVSSHQSFLDVSNIVLS